MTAAREAFVLPLILLTVTLLAGMQPGARLVFVPPSLFSLILGTLVIGALVRSGALDPSHLLHASRGMLANANGAMVLAALFAAASQVMAMLTPQNGLPRFFTCVFLFVLLVNTLVAQPDRVRLLRSLAVILGAGLILKFVVLAALSEPSGSTTARVLIALFDAATFGAITQDPQPPAAGYAAFAAAALFLVAAGLLPPLRRTGLQTASRMQLLEP